MKPLLKRHRYEKERKLGMVPAEEAQAFSAVVIAAPDPLLGKLLMLVRPRCRKPRRGGEEFVQLRFYTPARAAGSSSEPCDTQQNSVKNEGSSWICI